MSGLRFSHFAYSYQTEIGKLMPQMPYKIPDKPIKVRGGTHLEHMRRLFMEQMRLKEIAKSVTKLIDEERIELPYYRGYETRNYTERVIYTNISLPLPEADFFLSS